MKTVENSPVIRKRFNVDTCPEYRCRNCGAENSAIAHWTEIHYGTARVRDIGFVELDDYDTEDSDNFEVNNWECSECGVNGHNLERLFVPANEYVDGDENEEDD